MDLYYSGNFGGYHHRETAGRELCLNVSFSYGGYVWYIPAAYICTKGLMIDICRKVPAEQLKAFNDQWPDSRGVHLLKEQRGQLELNNPMRFLVSFDAVINGECVRSSGSTGNIWHPFLPDACTIPEEDWMNAYHLDRGSGWYLDRVRFPWSRANKGRLKALSITIRSNNVIHSCNKHFTCEPGCEPFEVIFKHPITLEPHELRVLSCAREEMDDSILGVGRNALDKKTIFPRNYCMLSYCISPPLLDGQHIAVNDCSEGDRPRNEAGGTAAGIGILSSSKGEGNIKYGISSLYYELVGEVEWYISTQIHAYEQEQIDLSEFLQILEKESE